MVQQDEYEDAEKEASNNIHDMGLSGKSNILPVWMDLFKC